MGGLFSKPAESTSTPESTSKPEPEPRSTITNDEQTAAKNKRKEEIEQKQKRTEDIKKAKADAEAKAKADAEAKAKTEEEEINKILSDPSYKIKSNKTQDEASNEVGENIIKLVGSLETKEFDKNFKELYHICKEWAGNKILNYSIPNKESGITGFTPLFIVVQKLPKSFVIPEQKTAYDNGLKIIKLLIAAGADVNAIATDKDGSKYSVIDKVSKFNPEAKTLIEDAGGKSSRGVFGNTLWGGKKRSIKKSKKRTAKATQKRKYKNKRKSTDRH
jgi:hypothetical protein